MSRFPDFLYSLTPRDEQVTGIEIVNHQFGTMSTAANVSSTPSSGNYTVPKGKVLIINSLTFFARAFATGQTIWAALRAIPIAGGSQVYYLAAGSPGNSLTTGLDNYFPATNAAHIIIPENYTLSIEMQFTVAGASSVFNGALNGILIPRGTIAI